MKSISDSVFISYREALINLNNILRKLDNNKKFNNVMNKLSFLSLFFLALFLFTSNAGLNLVHVFILLPGLYFVCSEWRVLLQGPSKWLLLYTLISLISILNSDIVDKGNSIGELRFFIFSLLAIPALQKFFDSGGGRKVPLLLVLVLSSTTIANINGIVGLFSGYSLLLLAPVRDVARSSGMYGMAITYGYGIQFFSLLSLYLLIIPWKKPLTSGRKILFFSSSLFTLLGLYFSYTRGAMLGFLCGFPFLWLNRSKKAVLAFIAIGCSGLVLLFGIIFFNVYEGNNRIFQSLNSDSNMIRLSQYEAAWYGFLENPITGVGFRNFSSKCESLKIKYDIAFKEYSSHAHNNFISALVGTGFFGFIALCLFHFSWLRQSIRRNDALRPCMVAFIVSLIVSGMFQNTLTDAENAFLIFAAFSLSQVRFKNLDI